MNPGAPPFRCIPGRPTTCNHATQAAVVARPHPSRAVRLRPTRLPPPGPPPRHRTTPRGPKGHALDKIHEPNHLRTAGDHCLKGTRAQMAGGRGRRRSGRWPRSAREHRPPPAAEEEGARIRRAASMRGHRGGLPAPSAAVQPQGPGWTGAAHLHRCRAAPPPEIQSERGRPRPAAPDVALRRCYEAATRRPAPSPCRPSPDATPPSVGKTFLYQSICN